MESTAVILTIVAIYMLIIAGISYYARRSSSSSAGFTGGGKAFPAAMIGFLLMSEFIGTSATIGTAQSAYEFGISAAWNVIALALGFILFSLLLAKKFRQLGKNTISEALAACYGDRTRIAVSLIMISALLIVAVAIYAAGGAVLHELLDIDRGLATVVVGVLGTLYVMIGGMRSVVYSNVLHAIMKIGTVGLLAYVGVHRSGGFSGMQAALPADAFSVSGVGWGQVFAWLIAGVGAIFATQYVIQAVVTVPDPAKAQVAGIWAAAMLIPFGVLAAIVGMASSILYPDIESIDALPVLAVDMNPVATGLVMCGLVGAILGSIAALILGSATLMLRDFYQPYFNQGGDDRRNVVFLRTATMVAGVAPIALALFASDVLSVTFLAKALRASLAVLVVLMFFKPSFGSRTGAFVSILITVPMTIGWFLAGDPFMDNSYIAILTPILVMTIAHLVSRNPADKAADVFGHPAEPEVAASRTT